MKKIFEKEVERVFNYSYKLDREENSTKIGVVVLEQSPQARTLFFSGNTCQAKRVNLPYIQFYISYVFDEKAELPYCFLGQGNNGLKVSCSLSPVKNKEDLVHLSPFEYELIICTPHSEREGSVYDGKKFKTLKDLQDDVIQTYLGLNHYPRRINLSKWSQADEQEIFGFNWGEKRTVETVLNHYYSKKSLVECTKDDQIQAD
ncbi:MAG: hypothetical protein EKK64_06700 [Neisseriaceae bacterium]|nr:MAG: hypothetical protein EKK64_06700 [Neisseriaceae bacterium]